jgi:hypothetical protein
MLTTVSQDAYNYGIVDNSNIVASPEFPSVLTSTEIEHAAEPLLDLVLGPERVHVCSTSNRNKQSVLVVQIDLMLKFMNMYVESQLNWIYLELFMKQVYPDVVHAKKFLSSGRKDWLHDFTEYQGICQTAKDANSVEITGIRKLVCDFQGY